MMPPQQDNKNIYKNLISLMEEDDRGGAANFIQEYFHSRYILLNNEFFDWQYRKNPYWAREKFSFKIFKNSGRFLGFLGFVPYCLSICGKPALGSALCNLMIRNECRALGLGLLFMRDIVHDFDIIWGTGYRQKTGPMYEKMGWRLMGNLRRHIKILAGKKMAQFVYGPEFESKNPFRIKSAPLPPTPDTIEIIDKFRKDAKILWQELSGKYPIAVERRPDYLNWRYVDHPSFQYTILGSRKGEKLRGYVVFRLETAREKKGNREYPIGRIVDLVACDDAEHELLTAALAHLSKSGAIMADYFCTGSFHKETLEQLGFVESIQEPYTDIPRRLNPIDRKRIEPINFVVYANPNMAKKNILYDINNWYITTGEGDTDRPN